MVVWVIWCSGNASPTWRAIEHSLELLKQGLIWRVGNGQLIRVWRDPWIPRNTSRRVISKQGNCRIKRASTFLDANGAWDLQKLSHAFLHVDVNDIVKIKTSCRGGDDFLAWHLEKNGMFTVRGAYRLAVNIQRREIGGEAASSQLDGCNLVWNHIWKCPVPQKVRIFAWKAATNSLATRDNKRRRRLELDDTCCVCGMEKDDVTMLFVAAQTLKLYGMPCARYGIYRRLISCESQVRIGC